MSNEIMINQLYN